MVKISKAAKIRNHILYWYFIISTTSCTYTSLLACRFLLYRSSRRGPVLHSLTVRQSDSLLLLAVCWHCEGGDVIVKVGLKIIYN